VGGIGAVSVTVSGPGQLAVHGNTATPKDLIPATVIAIVGGRLSKPAETKAPGPGTHADDNVARSNAPGHAFRRAARSASASRRDSSTVGALPPKCAGSHHRSSGPLGSWG